MRRWVCLASCFNSNLCSILIANIVPSSKAGSPGPRSVRPLRTRFAMPLLVTASPVRRAEQVGPTRTSTSVVWTPPTVQNTGFPCYGHLIWRGQPNRERPVGRRKAKTTSQSTATNRGGDRGAAGRRPDEPSLGGAGDTDGGPGEG